MSIACVLCYDVLLRRVDGDGGPGGEGAGGVAPGEQGQPPRPHGDQAGFIHMFRNKRGLYKIPRATRS